MLFLLLLLFDHTGKKKSGLEILQTYVIFIGHEVATFASLKFKSHLNLKKNFLRYKFTFTEYSTFRKY